MTSFWAARELKFVGRTMQKHLRLQRHKFLPKYNDNFIHKSVGDGDTWIMAKPVVIVTDVFVVELQQINPILMEMNIKNPYFFHRIRGVLYMMHGYHF